MKEMLQLEENVKFLLIWSHEININIMINKVNVL